MADIYILIKRGGRTIGKRPNTRLVLMTKCVVSKGGPTKFKGYIGPTKKTKGRWSKSKTEVQFDAFDIVKAFDGFPSPWEVKEAQQCLKIVE